MQYAVQRSLKVVVLKSDVTEIVSEKTTHMWEIENDYIDPVSGITLCDLSFIPMLT